MKLILNSIFHLLIIVLLTILTQIGGVIYFISLVFCKIAKLKLAYLKILVFTVFYFLSTLLIVPNIAPFFGRIKIVHSNKIKPANYLTVLMNRNYVVPKMQNLLESTEASLLKTDIQISYLDANFPFFNGFPLIPHLSHNDGKKLDICFIYQDQLGNITNLQKSFSGYGYFVKPSPKEFNQIAYCQKRGHKQYSLAKYLTLGKTNKTLQFSNIGTKKLIETILKNPSLGKVFIEPHLKTRLNLKHSKIRFQGCHSVRHDDHVHIQVK